MLLNLGLLFTVPPPDTLKAIGMREAQVIEGDDIGASAVAHLGAERVGILLTIFIILDVLDRPEPNSVELLVLGEPDHRTLGIILRPAQEHDSIGIAEQRSRLDPDAEIIVIAALGGLRAAVVLGEILIHLASAHALAVISKAELLNPERLILG